MGRLVGFCPAPGSSAGLPTLPFPGNMLVCTRRDVSAPSAALRAVPRCWQGPRCYSGPVSLLEQKAELFSPLQPLLSRVCSSHGREGSKPPLFPPVPPQVLCCAPAGYFCTKCLMELNMIQVYLQGKTWGEEPRSCCSSSCQPGHPSLPGKALQK